MYIYILENPLLLGMAGTVNISSLGQVTLDDKGEGILQVELNL